MMSRRTTSSRFSDAISIVSNRSKKKTKRFARYRQQEEQAPRMPMATHTHYNSTATSSDCGDGQSVFSYVTNATDMNEAMNIYAYSVGDVEEDNNDKNDNDDPAKEPEVPAIPANVHLGGGSVYYDNYDPEDSDEEEDCDEPYPSVLKPERQLLHQQLDITETDDSSFSAEGDQLQQQKRVSSLQTMRAPPQEPEYIPPTPQFGTKKRVSLNTPAPTTTRQAPTTTTRQAPSTRRVPPTTRRARPNLMDCTFGESTAQLDLVQSNPVIATERDEDEFATPRQPKKKESLWTSFKRLTTGTKNSSRNKPKKAPSTTTCTTTTTTTTKTTKGSTTTTTTTSGGGPWLSFRRQKRTKVITLKVKKSEGLRRRQSQRRLQQRLQQEYEEQLTAEMDVSYRSERRASF